MFRRLALFSAPVKWAWTECKSFSWNAVFVIGPVTYTVNLFEHDHKLGKWELAFVAATATQEFGFDVSGTGNAFTVYGTVIAIARAFIAKMKPAIIWIESSSPKRRVINRHVADDIAKGLSYTVVVDGWEIYINAPHQGDGAKAVASHVASGSYELAPGLIPANYKLGPLSQVGKWQARIILANSAGEKQEIGDWDDVGYVMVSMTTNHIVPIARADEHNTGYELLHDMANPPKRSKVPKVALDPRDFQPIYKYGSNFVYDQADMTKLAMVAKKWLAWGGPDVVVRGSQEAEGVFGKLSDLVKSALTLKPQPGKVNAAGANLIQKLHALSDLVTKREMATRESKDTGPLDRSIFSAAHKVVGDAVPIMQHIWVDAPDPNELAAQVQALEQANDVKQLEALMFGFKGVKNAIHQKLRAALQQKKSLDRDRITPVFGDLKLADGLMASL